MVSELTVPGASGQGCSRKELRGRVAVAVHVIKPSKPQETILCRARQAVEEVYRLSLGPFEISTKISHITYSS